MQSPGEIQLMILRRILKHPKSLPIGRRAMRYYAPMSNLDDCAYAGDLQSSSQLLRTCQQLHLLCQDVLYSENTVTFFIQQSGIGRSSELRCYFLNDVVEISADLGERVDEFKDVFIGPYLSHATFQEWPEMHPAVKNFSTYQIILTSDTRGAVFMACHLLRDLVRQKRVVFRIDVSTTNTALENQADPSSLLSACKMLRCKSIDFPNYPVEETVTLSALITDMSSPSINMYTLYVSYLEQFIDKIPAFNGDSKTECKHFIRRLKNLALQYDVEGFKKQRATLTEKAQNWMQENVRKIKAKDLKRLKKIAEWEGEA